MSNNALFWCPNLAGAVAPYQGVCLESLQGLRHLGHVELVQGRSGALMILRHTAPLSAADKEKLNAFRILRGCLCFWPRKAR